MRERITISVDYALNLDLKELGEITRIPVSRLCDEAIEDLLIKHDFKKLCENETKKSLE